jgi:diguanylate cyclase (GGDEF)-like protein
MTSLKKHIEAVEYGSIGSVFDACSKALMCVGRNAERALPGIKSDLKSALNEFVQRLRNNNDSPIVEDTHNRLELEVSRWADSVIADQEEKTVEVKGMMLTLTAAAESINKRDSRNSTKFGELSTRLQAAGRLEDLSAIRLQLTASVKDLKENLQRMEDESRATLAHLQSQINVYRAQAAESEKRASTDPLTGLKNRRGVEMAFESRRQRQSPFSLILLDLNRFKEINDTYGHLAGDQLLKHFGSELLGQFRPGDVVGRWGGDEFIIITDASPFEIESCTTQVRRWVFGMYKVQTPGGPLKIKLDAAIGITAWNRGEGLDGLLSRADALMYAEKRVRA